MPYSHFKKYIENDVGKENQELLHIAKRTILRSPSPPYTIKKFDDIRSTAEKEFVGLVFNRQVTQTLKSKWDVVDGYQTKFREDVLRINDHVTQQHARYELAVQQGVKDRISNFDITSKIEKLGTVAIHYGNYKRDLEQVIDYLRPCNNFLEECCKLMNMNKNVDLLNRHKTLTLFKESLTKDFDERHLELEAEHQRLRDVKENFEKVYVESNTILGGLISSHEELIRDNKRMERGIESFLKTASGQFLLTYRKFNAIQAIYEKVQQQRGLSKDTSDPVEMMSAIQKRMLNMTEVVADLTCFFNKQTRGHGHTDITDEKQPSESKIHGLKSLKAKWSLHRPLAAKAELEQLKGSKRLLKELPGYETKRTVAEKLPASLKSFSSKSTGKNIEKRKNSNNNQRHNDSILAKNLNSSVKVKEHSKLVRNPGAQLMNANNSSHIHDTIPATALENQANLFVFPYDCKGSTTAEESNNVRGKSVNCSNKERCALSENCICTCRQLDIDEPVSGETCNVVGSTETDQHNKDSCNFVGCDVDFDTKYGLMDMKDVKSGSDNHMIHFHKENCVNHRANDKNSNKISYNTHTTDSESDNNENMYNASLTSSQIYGNSRSADSDQDMTPKSVIDNQCTTGNTLHKHDWKYIGKSNDTKRHSVSIGYNTRDRSINDATQLNGRVPPLSRAMDRKSKMEIPKQKRKETIQKEQSQKQVGDKIVRSTQHNHTTCMKNKRAMTNNKSTLVQSREDKSKPNNTLTRWPAAEKNIMTSPTCVQKTDSNTTIRIKENAPRDTNTVGLYVNECVCSHGPDYSQKLDHKGFSEIPKMCCFQNKNSYIDSSKSTIQTDNARHLNSTPLTKKRQSKNQKCDPTKTQQTSGRLPFVSTSLRRHQGQCMNRFVERKTQQNSKESIKKLNNNCEEAPKKKAKTDKMIRKTTDNGSKTDNKTDVVTVATTQQEADVMMSGPVAKMVIRTGNVRYQSAKKNIWKS